MEDKKIKDVLYGDEALQPLILGVLKAAKIVSSTMGPSGNTVVIPSRTDGGFAYKITKDGVSVVRSIRLADPVENIGASLIKEAAENTLREAGDGTTTATVLTKSLIENMIIYPQVAINQVFDKELDLVLTKLKNYSKKLTKSDIKNIASISCNGDDAMSDMIVKAYRHSKIVKVIETQHGVDRLENIQGMLLNVGTLTPYNITDTSKNETHLTKPIVIILEDKLTSLKSLHSVLSEASASSTPVLIITEHVSESVKDTLYKYFAKTSLKISVMKSPGYSSHRANLLRDLAKYTNAKVVKLSEFKRSDAGLLESATIGANESILVKDDTVDVEEYVGDLETRSKNPDLEEHDLDLLKMRIENLSGGFAQIKVGGASELERYERKDRYEDAVLAVACALDEGVVEGGGVALARIAISNLKLDQDGEIIRSKTPNPIESFYAALLAPFITIQENGHQMNINITSDELEMFELNIIDPLKVTRTALVNAVSIARSILSTRSVVIDSMEWRN